jgi:thiol-disulfide isomerase/thioredoxin
MIVKIHADWCGTCMKLAPVFEVLERDVGDRATIVIFDVTDRTMVERSRKEADRLGIRPFFDANQAKTGIVAVLDARGQVVAHGRGELDPAWYADALQKAALPAARSGS